MLYNNWKKLIKSKDISGFVVNNKIMVNIPIKLLMNQKIIKPQIQGILDKDKMLEIVKYQDNYYKSGKRYFNFMGSINIHSCIETKNDYLVDGQHRYESLKELYQKYNYNNENVIVEVVSVQTEEELINNYNIINKNTELPEFPDDIDKNVPEQAALFFFNKYPEIFVTTKRTKRPHINKNLFQEAMGVLNSEINRRLNCNKTKDELIDIINEKNDRMCLWPVESYQKRIRKMKCWDTYKRLADSYGFYLGMYTSCDRENYLFRWVRDIIHERTGEEIKKVRKKTNRRKIPQVKRKMVWERYIGNVVNSKCYCCGISEINSINNFECGHVISKAMGGDESIDNLRPICSSCNKSMGTENLYEFMKLNYSENYNNLNLKIENKNSKIKI